MGRPVIGSEDTRGPQTLPRVRSAGRGSYQLRRERFQGCSGRLREDMCAMPMGSLRGHLKDKTSREEPVMTDSRAINLSLKYEVCQQDKTLH